MLMHHKLCSMFLLLLPIEIVHATGGGREISRNITTIRHLIDPSVQFVSQPFPVQGESDGRLLTAPHPSFSTVVAYDAGYARTQEERPSSPEAAGYSNRIYVQRADAWPYSPQGHLKLFFGEEECDGSGVLVGPHHVLTCAHNVYKPGEKRWVDKIIFCPGLVGQSAPFGSATVTSIYIDKAWTGDDDTADIALLTLSVPLGQKTGYLGLGSMSDDDLGSELVEVTGYPADKGAVYMWTMFHELKKNMTRDTLDYEIDTYQGQSGGAVWIQHGEGDIEPYVIGVHTRGKTSSNRGVRISALKFTWLIKLLSETAELQGSASGGPSPLREPIRLEDAAANLLARQQNEAQKLKLFEGPATAGNKRAQRYLANLYRTGQGVARSLGRALYWYQKAAAQDDPIAQKMLGDFYKMGKGVEKSFERAVVLYQKASDLDNEYAAKALADCYKAGGPGLPQSDEKAFEYYQKAANRNLVSAQERLANCYYSGKGIAQNYDLAFQWYKKAAEQDHPVAQKMLGDLYRDGQGVAQSYEIAASLYLQSANQGNAYAQKALGDLYRTGHGVSRSVEIATQWYTKAADKLDSAKEALKRLMA